MAARFASWSDGVVAMTLDHKGSRIARAIALLVFVVIFALPCAAPEKFRFLIGESSKNLSYGPLWVAAKMGFFEREGLDVPIITMLGSPIPSMPPACGLGIVYAAALHGTNHIASAD
jgi:ABC-type nitrate/sulfonate/bicarbonate transport system substrate-binding protein